jgi:hypothetical protein
MLAEMILYAVLAPTVAKKAKLEQLVKILSLSATHCDKLRENFVASNMTSIADQKSVVK